LETVVGRLKYGDQLYYCKGVYTTMLKTRRTMKVGLPLDIV